MQSFYLHKEKKIKFHVEKDCLDMDDLIEVELPTDYIGEKHDDIMRQLGEESMESRKRYIMFQNYLNYQKNSGNINININNPAIANNMPFLNSHYSEKNKSDLLMKNDDFLILLSLMRNKKNVLYEKKPYYVNYKVNLDDVYINEKDQNEGVEEKEKTVYADVENFVRSFMDFDPNVV
jgi:hypothetical protein